MHLRNLVDQRIHLRTLVCQRIHLRTLVPKRKCICALKYFSANAFAPFAHFSMTPFAPYI
jgi:hypothetical protein